MPEKFDWQISSPLKIPPQQEWRFQSIAEMLTPANQQEANQPVFLGADKNGSLNLSLHQLQRAAANALAWCKQQGISAGDSMLLLRAPQSSEVPLAATALALMSLGIRVVLPMSFDRNALKNMLTATESRAMLWCTSELDKNTSDSIVPSDTMFREVAEELDLPVHSIDEDLCWYQVENNVTCQTPSHPESLNREVLVLSTSGSTGNPKLVRYTEEALLKVAEAWNQAGLMSAELTGGRSICPALAHSMGFRSVFHAVWNRQPTLLAQTELIEENPKQYVTLLENCQPEHVTCGPALLGDLALLSGTIKRMKQALGSLRCVVSSGAAAIALEEALPENVRIANAFGMTELQQAMNTLLSPEIKAKGSLGSPLPGVSVAVQLTDPVKKIGKLFVSAPFAAKGYVGQSDFGPWFETGDLVRIEGEELVWVGRTQEDFLNTGQGVKVSLADLQQTYSQLAAATEAIVFVELSKLGGVGALVFVGESDPANSALHKVLLEAITVDHKRLAERQQDFELQYMTLVRVGVIQGRPPKRGPGKIDSTSAVRQQEPLLSEMNCVDPNHPHVVTVPAFGSDRPDWRRYASPTS